MRMKDIAHDTFISDEQLARLFCLADEGKGFAEALDAAGLSALSGAERDEVRALWRMYLAFSDDARAAGDLSRAAAEALLEKIKEGVVEKGEELLEKNTEAAGPSTSPGSIASPWNAFFAAPWKVAVPLAVLALAVTAMLGTVVKNGAPAPLPGDAPAPDSAMEAPTTMMFSAPAEEALDAARMSAKSMATSSGEAALDEAFSALEREALGDPESLNDAAEEAALVESDAGALSDIEQAYDE